MLEKNDPSGASDGFILQRVHPIECFRAMGWDLEHFKDMATPFKYVGDEFIDADLLQNLIGNAWISKNESRHPPHTATAF